MLETTEAHFRRKLKEDIKRLCDVSDKLFLEEDKFESVFQLYRRYRDSIHQCIEDIAEIDGLFIKFPECQHSKYKDYITNFIMLLDETQKQFLNISSEKFQPSSLFVISHLFFLIDAYSYQKNRCLILESGFAPDTGS
jgi:hypothetical protein